MYLSLTTLSVYVPPKVREDVTSEKTLVEAAVEIVVDAFRGFRFENVNLGKICLGVAGASSLRSGALTRTSKIVEMLMDSIKGYGGEPSFGSFFWALLGRPNASYVPARKVDRWRVGGEAVLSHR
jgi:hypothetical protein